MDAYILRRGWVLVLALGLGALLFATAGAWRAVAQEEAPKAKRVALHILVIEAHKKEGQIEKRLEALAKNMPGYRGARLLDELNTSAEEGTSVSLEIQAGTKRTMKVTVRKIDDKKDPKEIKLRVAIEALKLSVDPTYLNGGTFLIHHPIEREPEKALFLVISPKL